MPIHPSHEINLMMSYQTEAVTCDFQGYILYILPNKGHYGWGKKGFQKGVRKIREIKKSKGKRGKHRDNPTHRGEEKTAFLIVGGEKSKF